jgi:surface protein
MGASTSMNPSGNKNPIVEENAAFLSRIGEIRKAALEGRLDFMNSDFLKVEFQGLLYNPKLTRTDADIRAAVNMWCNPRTQDAASDKYGHICDWETSRVTNMNNLFSTTKRTKTGNTIIIYENMKLFNDDISKWDVSKVTNMESMFSGASKFNQPIDKWNTAAVTNMKNMFYQAGNFNQPIDKWNTSAVTNMSYMFYQASYFNQPIGKWNTSAVTNMTGMFREATFFNQPIGEWDTKAVTSMKQMFYRATTFNQPIVKWNTAAVTNMNSMFYEAHNFNRPIDKWNTATVTDMNSMFYEARNFNQPINNWDTNAVTETGMDNIFTGCPIDDANKPVRMRAGGGKANKHKHNKYKMIRKKTSKHDSCGKSSYKKNTVRRKKFKV